MSKDLQIQTQENSYGPAMAQPDYPIGKPTVSKFHPQHKASNGILEPSS